ncbi:MAG TPA: hypothetical protein VMF53_06635 [Alphaproteobacteria bacterium]|nr:hypothetical protein [Alphaproteobacteria bacterium]
MTRAQVCAYLGIGDTTFDAERRAGIWPPGRPIGRGHEKRWDRKLVDLAYDRLSGLVQDEPRRLTWAERLKSTVEQRRPVARPQKGAIPYLVKRPSGWYWQPARRIRELGFTFQALGKDEEVAIVKARELNRQAEAARRARAEEAE